MSITIVGKRGEGWRVQMRGFGFVTRSGPMTKQEAVKLAAECLERERKAKHGT